MDEKRTLFGMELPYFILVSAITAAAMYLGYLPKGMVGAFPVMIFMGVILNVIGDHAPVIKTYFGGGHCLYFCFCLDVLAASASYWYD